MGARKRLVAEARKEANKTKYFAKLNDCPTSPRKMRLVADQVRGENVDKALAILKYSPKAASNSLEKLLLSAIANWQTKNDGASVEEANLYIKELFVDSARVLKRLRPRAQGRANRIRKRSNHVTLVVESAPVVESKKAKK
jgi:large subunit ribosomal protein L22